MMTAGLYRKFRLTDWSFVAVRVLTVGFIIFWLINTPSLTAATYGYIRHLLLGFVGYSILLYAFVIPQSEHRGVLYAIGTVLDVVFVVLLVQWTGGLKSEFFILFYFLIALFALYFGLWQGFFCAFIITVLYLFNNQEHVYFMITGKILSADLDPGTVTLHWSDLLVRILFQFLVAGTLGLFSHKNRHDINLLKEAHHKLDSVNKITEAIRSSMQLDTILELILTKVNQDLGFDRVFLYLLEREGLRSVLRYKKGIGVPEEVLKNKSYSVGGATSEAAKVGSTGIISRVVEQKKAYNITNARNNYLCDQDLVERLDLEAFAAVPLKMGDQVFGVLIVDHRGSAKPIPDSDIQSLVMFANQAAVAIENARLHEETQQLAILDGLTNIFNHRYFQEFLGDEILRARRYQNKFSLIISDIDFFKHYNDTWGHPKGDEVLKDIAQIFKDNVRNIDMVARYGGEEFVIVLPHTDKEGAVMIAERIRAAVEKTPFPNQDQQPNGNVTVSLGVATYPDDADNKQDLIEKADEQVYRAKKQGKNMVCTAE